jgi:hypothetical protein
MFRRDVFLQSDIVIVNIHIIQSVSLQGIIYHSSYFYEMRNRGAPENKNFSYTPYFSEEVHHK